jgi:hypothetical protein
VEIIFGNIVAGAIGGILIGVSGYFKANETIDTNKLIPTVLIAMVIGMLSGITGYTNTEVEAMSVSALVTYIVQSAYVGFLKRK